MGIIELGNLVDLLFRNTTFPLSNRMDQYGGDRKRKVETTFDGRRYHTKVYQVEQERTAGVSLHITSAQSRWGARYNHISACRLAEGLQRRYEFKEGGYHPIFVPFGAVRPIKQRI